MSSFNKVILMGNLTKDPILKQIPNGATVTNFSMAINRKYKHNNQAKEETCYVDVVAWAKQAENCNKYLKKGSRVLIEGYLNYRQWETPKKEMRNKLEVVLNTIHFLSSINGNQKQENDT